ncbi:MAG: Gfo/Idh/MocA family oxidoreductase [Clostridia bacterium]|nr:Gfo/Idh/MocA family oxidoreductase [Clostridia bacterium]
MSKEIRIGVFGCSRGMNYAKLFAQDDTFEIVAFCDKNEERRRRAAETYPDIPVFPDFDGFISYGAEHGMNAVFLANYFHEHAPYAIKVMEAGMAALSECLPAATLKQCCDLVRTTERLGGKYMFCENYPFMTGNLELTRLCREGTLGTVMYLEGEYNHHDDPAALYGRSQGRYHWRNWEPRCYYLSHSLAPLMAMSGGIPRYVSAQAAVSQLQKERFTFRAVSDGMAQMLCKFDNGAVARFSGCNGIASGYSAYRAFGDRGAAEWGAHTDRKIRLHFSSWNCPEGVPETQFYDPAESVCRTDPDVAKGLSAGHGGSDYLVVRKIVAFLRDGVMPYFDVYRAAAISATAALALKSCLANGEMYRIPDFRCAEEMKEVENDDLTPFYDDEGHGGTIRPSLEYTPEQFDKVGVFNG